ncbi:MAG: UDP-N-acetylmuramoyl-L-alanine--D-glutamate ligase, partial [Spirochaetia bacterium]|nr:UDP-N-acetylmuramoyl-L-alanine--D-glutamate ligase [Spirochaetia bacterium]
MRLRFKRGDIPGLRVTVMGLGLNGGGLESARFFARSGAQVTVTDLRGEGVLAPSIKELEGLPVRYVLGGHESGDFRNADIVIKNPAVRPDSPYLAQARRIETDMSVFLSLCPGPVLAVTGSKGKSSTSSALHFGLQALYPGACLGGNITRSPLSFLDGLRPEDPVVLELSSWQLGDIKGKGLLKPKVAIITNILPDHMDRYGGMEPYVADKKVIYENQDPCCHTLYLYGDPWGEPFARETPGTPLAFSRTPLPPEVPGAWLENGEGFARLENHRGLRILPRELRLAGSHQKINLLAAGLALRLFGLDAGLIQERLGRFPGIEHRLELCGEKAGVRFYNDSTATIPEALCAAVQSFPGLPLSLIAGGTDKELDFGVFAGAAGIPKSIYLLEGSATPKLQNLLRGLNIAYNGPYSSLEKALADAAEAAPPGGVVVFSPGCTSYGMFLNEFDRGHRFKEMVAKITGT